MTFYFNQYGARHAPIQKRCKQNLLKVLKITKEDLKTYSKNFKNIKFLKRT